MLIYRWFFELLFVIFLERHESRAYPLINTPTLASFPAFLSPIAHNPV